MREGFGHPGKQAKAATTTTPRRPVAKQVLTEHRIPASAARHASPVDDQSVAFLAGLRQAVIEAADEELAGTGWTAEQCPWIEYWFSYYSMRSVTDVRAALRKFVPEARDATTADEYTGPLTTRVRAAIHKWRATGEVDAPAGTDTRLGGDGELVAMTSSLRGGERVTVPEAVASALGATAPEVRLHTDATANRFAERAGALAYTVGNHIVYSASAPRPGSLAGDALLAHELAHTHQQRGVAGGAPSVASAETNADRAVAHAAAAQLGLRGMLGRTWSAVAAPLGLQRCKSKSKSNAAEIAQDQQDLADVNKIIDTPHMEFSALAAAITKREALVHWISTLSGGRGTRTGTSAPETGVEGCNCTTYVVVVLREAFKKSGREADWKNVLARTYKIKGKNEVDGVELQSALRSELGWKAIFWAPDPLYPSYQRRPRPYDNAPPGTEFVHDTENRDRYALATRADRPVYRIQPGTKSDEDLRISYTVTNYAPETAGRSITIAGGDSTTKKNTTGLERLARIPFGVLTAHGGTHMALILSGVVYEVHWDQHSGSPHLYARTPLETWGWGSGIVVAPADDVDKAFK